MVSNLKDFVKRPHPHPHPTPKSCQITLKIGLPTNFNIGNPKILVPRINNDEVTDLETVAKVIKYGFPSSDCSRK